MGLGVKTGGRTWGTPNKRTQDVIENLAAQMYKELAPYIAPKRKAIEQTIKNEWEGVTKDGEANYRGAIMSLSREDKILVFSSIEPDERLELIQQLEVQES